MGDKPKKTDKISTVFFLDEAFNKEEVFSSSVELRYIFGLRLVSNIRLFRKKEVKLKGSLDPKFQCYPSKVVPVLILLYKAN